MFSPENRDLGKTTLYFVRCFDCSPLPRQDPDGGTGGLGRGLSGGRVLCPELRLSLAPWHIA